MGKKRGNNEGTIFRRKDGRWVAQLTTGRDPKTGKRKRTVVYGKTRKEVAPQTDPRAYSTARASTRTHPAIL
jgi:hypothetical protein